MTRGSSCAGRRIQRQRSAERGACGGDTCCGDACAACRTHTAQLATLGLRCRPVAVCGLRVGGWNCVAARSRLGSGSDSTFSIRSCSSGCSSPIGRRPRQAWPRLIVGWKRIVVRDQGVGFAQEACRVRASRVEERVPKTRRRIPPGGTASPAWYENRARNGGPAMASDPQSPPTPSLNATHSREHPHGRTALGPNWSADMSSGQTLRV
jgi:hypothetical protein